MDESTAGVAMCAVNDLRVAALPFWMVLHPSRQLVHAANGSARSSAAPQPRNAGGGYNRIDLNSDPSARLRTDDQGPRVRRDYHDR